MSSRLLCCLRTDGGILMRVSTPLRSFPEFVKFAQSRAPCPGASCTFLETFGRFVVLVGNARVFGVEGIDSEFEVVVGTPGVLFANPGTGGGGISPATLSDNILGGPFERDEDGAAMRCALLRAGNAGGVSSKSSSSPLMVIVSASSSSCSGSYSSILGTGGGGAGTDVNQLLR